MINDNLIEKLKKSKILDVVNQNLTDEDIKKITSKLKGYEGNKERLDLSKNKLGPLSILYLKEFIENSSLHTIILKDNSIKEEGVIILAEMIAKSKTLYILDLNKNNITSKGIKHLSESLKNTEIMCLNLSDNNIGDEGLKNISDMIKYTKTHTLALNNNQITSKGIKYFSKTLKDSDISFLDLEENAIDDEGVKYLADAIENSKIEKFRLNLKNNKFQDLGFLYLENTFKKLSVLDIRENCFDYNSIQRLFRGGIHYEGSLSFNVFNNEQNGNCEKILTVEIHKYFQSISIDLISDKIESKLSLILNENLRKYRMVHITISFKTLSKQYIKNLKNAFNGARIYNIDFDILSKQPELFAEIFEDCEIFYIMFSYKLKSISISHLGIFLEKVKIYKLSLRYINISNDELQDLVPKLKNPLFKLSLQLEQITNQSVEILKEFLLQRFVGFFDLFVKQLNVNEKQRITDQLKDIKFSKIKLNGFLLPYNEDLDKTVSQIFKDLTYFNDSSEKYEFKVPQKKCSIDEFFHFIKNLKQNTKSKFYLYGYNESYEIGKINEFVETLSNEFITFFNKNLTKMDEIFDNFNFLTFLKFFDEIKMDKNCKKFINPKK